MRKVVKMNFEMLFSENNDTEQLLLNLYLIKN